MIRKYKLEFKNHWAVLNHFITTSIGLLFASVIIGKYQNWAEFLYIYLIIYWIIDLILITVLHYQYFAKSKHIQITINSLSKFLIIENFDESKTIDFDEIEKIKIFMVPSMYRGSTFQIMSWEPFYYALIYTQDDKFIITCLVMKDIMKELDYFGLKYTKVKRILPYIKTPK